MLSRRWMAVGVVVVVVAACGEDAGSDPPDAGDTSAGEVAAEADGDIGEERSGGVVAVATTELGDVLVDGAGMTLYLFDPDDAGASTCYDSCASAWPPVEGPVEAGDGLDASLLGTTERDDGTVQATYAGWPLYLYAADAEAGDVNGQGAEGVWWVLSEAGERVTDGDVAGEEEDAGGGY